MPVDLLFTQVGAQLSASRPIRRADSTRYIVEKTRKLSAAFENYSLLLSAIERGLKASSYFYFPRAIIFRICGAQRSATLRIFVGGSNLSGPFA
jgi:hypothetical protein